MKNIYLIITLLLLTCFAKAQEAQPDLSEKKQQDIEALKVAFISKELDLTPDEAQKFWPVYNQYSKELKTVSSGTDENVLDRDEKVLNLRKRYKDQFTKLLGPDRMNRMFNAEGRFRQILIRAMNRQNKNQLRPNRPMLRRGQQ